MSVLLVGLAPEVTAALIDRLVGQDDEVRVVEPDERNAEQWRAAGAFVALGSPDEDLVERAAQGVRTVIVGDDVTGDKEVLHGAARARVERIVVFGHKIDPDTLEPDFVVLRPPRRRLLKGPELSPSDAARAIDAAEDLAGEPQLVLDLGTAAGWRALDLGPPARMPGG